MYTQTLQRLRQNLNILREREAKYAGNAPLELLNQIDDHAQAIALTHQAQRRELSEAEWRESLRPLLVDIRGRSEAHPEWGVTVGDVEGGIIGAIIAGRDISAGGDIVTGVKGKQSAQGEGIAQVIGSGTAIVNYYQLASPAPVDPETLAAARARLAGLPLDGIPPVATLPPGSRLPYAANPHFVGREAELMELAGLLKGGQMAAIGQAVRSAHGQIAAATGLGGIGKSQLAVAFAHRYGQYFAGGVYWLSFADPAAIPAEIAACAPPGSEGLELEIRVRRVLSDWQSGLPRLLIFDNCEDESLLARWRPPTGQSRVLVTSRRQQWSATLGVQPLSLRTLPRAKSIELLRRFLPSPPTPSPNLGEGSRASDGVRALNTIAAELGDLPLALHLAGSFLARYTRVTPADYLTQLRSLPPGGGDVTKLSPPDPPKGGASGRIPPSGGPGGLKSAANLTTAPPGGGNLLAHPSLTGRAAAYSPTGHDLHVAKTFTLSYKRLAPADPIDALARQLLARAACFAPGEPVPTDLLLATLEVEAEAEAKAEANDSQSATPALRAGASVRNDSPRSVAEWGSQFDLDDALHRLTELGLLEPTGADAVTLHRLLAAFAQQTDPDPAAQPAVEQAILDEARRLNKAGIPGPLLAWQPHLRYLTDKAFQRDDDTAESLCVNLGYHLKMIGDYIGARPFYERAVEIAQKIFGDSHNETALCLNNLASLLQDQGDTAGALPYYERALAIREQVLGPDHPSTATSLNNLASLLQDQGDTAGALPYYERALAIKEQVLGPDHPDTATSLNNLAVLLKDQGDTAGALPYYERALAIREQVLGPEHPDTATSLNNLALLLKDQGDTAGALPYLERALAIREQVLGPDHPDTATSLNNLALLLQAQGDYAGALPYYERALAIEEQVLGPEHPSTATSLNNLALLLQDQRDYAGALPYYERALAIREQVLGPDHPDTAASLNNLAGLLQDQGDTAGALPYYERALAIREQVLGPDHPDTAASLNNLAGLLQDQGDTAGALPYLERALAIREQVLGPEHPDTARSLNNLASLLQDQGDTAGALPYYERALAIVEKKLGSDHPHSRIVRGNLQSLLDQLGDNK